MKIIFITREGYRLPGARIRCYNLAKDLSVHGVRTEVLSFSDNLRARDGEEESLMGMSEKLIYNWRAFRRLVKDKEAIFYIQRFNYHSFAPYLVSLIRGNRIILDLDDWEMRDNPRYYFGFYPSSKAHYLTKEIAKRSIFCIAASRFLEEFLLQFNKKVYYIPSGVDTELFSPSSNGLEEKEIIFSWIGTLHKREYIENINFALDCFQKLKEEYPNIYFEIVGGGIYRKELTEHIAKRANAHIRFKGWLAPEGIPEYLNSIHIGLFPVVSNNKFNWAKSPTKLFEYMAMAKPSVSSNIGEATHIIKDGENGFLAKTKEEFTEKMRRLIQDSGLRKSMGQNARHTVNNNYSLKILGRQLYEALKSPL